MVSLTRTVKMTGNNRRWAIVIGIGMALSPIHNLYLTHLLTNSKGETLFFLPAFGYLILIMGAGLFLLDNWRRVKDVGWGDKRLVIPLFIVVGAIALSGITAEGLEAKFAPTGMGLALFALYLCGRVQGKDMFLPLAVGAVIASLGVIAHQIVYPGAVTGGFVFEDNYDIVVGYVLLGATLWIHRWQWILAGLALVAILLTGSPEGIFALGVVGVTILIRRDWGKKLAIILAIVAIVVIAGIVSGYGQSLYEYTSKVATGEIASPYGHDGVRAIEHRLDVITDNLTHIRPLGYGYTVTNFSNPHCVHNVPLVLVQQLGYPGILAGLAWLWVSIFCLVRTRWKYVWVLIMALSAFDHFMWTQLAPCFWLIAGVSTAPDNIKSDLLFRRNI